MPGNLGDASTSASALLEALKPLIYHPEASAELDAAVERYESLSVGLGSHSSTRWRRSSLALGSPPGKLAGRAGGRAVSDRKEPLAGGTNVTTYAQLERCPPAIWSGLAGAPLIFADEAHHTLTVERFGLLESR